MIAPRAINNQGVLWLCGDYFYCVSLQAKHHNMKLHLKGVFRRKMTEDFEYPAYRDNKNDSKNIRQDFERVLKLIKRDN